MSILSVANVHFESTGANRMDYIAASGDVRLNTTGQFIITANKDVRVGTTSPNTIVFQVNSVERARIDSSGRVGIGTIAPVAAGLTIGYNNILAFPNATNSYSATSGAQLFKFSDNNFYIDSLDGNIIFRRANYNESVRIDATGNVGIGITSPVAKFDLSGTNAQNIVSVAASDIDCSAGNFFTKTIAGATTFTFSNVPASRAFSFMLELTVTSGSVTWPASVVWPGSTVPTFASSKTTLFMFVTDDGGTRWRGAALTDYTT